MALKSIYTECYCWSFICLGSWERWEPLECLPMKQERKQPSCVLFVPVRGPVTAGCPPEMCMDSEFPTHMQPNPNLDLGKENLCPAKFDYKLNNIFRLHELPVSCGNKLATSSGDTTVKLWDVSKGNCILTFEGHTHAVWSCTWHSCGDFVASSSLDTTSKIWDVNSERCRYTLYGHTDSVNSIEFFPYSNTLLTGSADKSLSIWDTRTVSKSLTFFFFQF
ncbi:PREDICTED: sperm-associated antigen 16 protein-like [Bison bison bison]|uniref:Sperm-associated antigen 16 protein-like n=1 Tax=Bison bison bison TaxID=43346 RepID=A0A6P3IZ72_BISBB|nr:PREDICTED: sperm-associated antigen 16 protein-like [Bison bison bison]